MEWCKTSYFQTKEGFTTRRSTITLFICSLHGEIISDDIKHVTNNTLRPIKISREGPSFSHLLFADDCLLFTEANSSQVKLVKDVLRKFCFVSSNVSRAKQHKFEFLLQFNHTSHIGKYLGFSMLPGRVKNSNFNFLLFKINGQLAGWKLNLLGRPGRVTLAKSVVTVMLIYTIAR